MDTTTNCKHDPANWIIEIGEDWPTSPEDTPYEYKVYVCGDCGEIIPLDVADPEADRIDALADMAEDDWRDE